MAAAGAVAPVVIGWRCWRRVRRWCWLRLASAGRLPPTKTGCHENAPNGTGRPACAALPPGGRRDRPPVRRDQDGGRARLLPSSCRAAAGGGRRDRPPVQRDQARDRARLLPVSRRNAAGGGRRTGKNPAGNFRGGILCARSKSCYLVY